MPILSIKNQPCNAVPIFFTTSFNSTVISSLLFPHLGFQHSQGELQPSRCPATNDALGSPTPQWLGVATTPGAAASAFAPNQIERIHHRPRTA